jgi:hypothetical protein
VGSGQHGVLLADSDPDRPATSRIATSRRRAGRHLWSYTCSDGSVQLTVQVNQLHGTKDLQPFQDRIIVYDFDLSRTENPITKRMTRTAFLQAAQKLSGRDTPLLAVQLNRQKFLDTFGEPNGDSPLPKYPERAWTYRCQDGRVTLKMSHLYGKDRRGKTVYGNEIIVWEVTER